MTRSDAPRQAVWMTKIYTAWRTENAVKTSNGARDLSRAVRPEKREWKRSYRL